MIRLGRLSGLPVVLGGRMIGRVEQAVLTPDARRLRGLVIRHGLGAARWVAAADVRLIGEVSVIIAARPGKLPQGADFALTTVRDTGGMRLGRVTDVFLDPATMETAALEVSLGLVEALTIGRQMARTFAPMPSPDDPGQVLIPCGAVLEAPPQPALRN